MDLFGCFKEKKDAMCYDLFFVSGQKTTALFLFTFSLMGRKETSSKEQASLVFRR
jgi:hypothetical protein